MEFVSFDDIVKNKVKITTDGINGYFFNNHDEEIEKAKETECDNSMVKRKVNNNE